MCKFVGLFICLPCPYLHPFHPWKTFNSQYITFHYNMTLAQNNVAKALFRLWTREKHHMGCLSWKKTKKTTTKISRMYSIYLQYRCAFIGRPTWQRGFFASVMVGCLVYWASIQNWTLQWRHNGRDSVSNHQPHDCLLNCISRSRWQKTSKLCVTGLCVGNSPVTRKMFPFDDVTMNSCWLIVLHHTNAQRNSFSPTFGLCNIMRWLITIIFAISTLWTK